MKLITPKQSCEHPLTISTLCQLRTVGKKESTPPRKNFINRQAASQNFAREGGWVIQKTEVEKLLLSRADFAKQ